LGTDYEPPSFDPAQVAENNRGGYLKIDRDMLITLRRSVPPNAFCLATLLLEMANYQESITYFHEIPVAVKRGDVYACQKTLCEKSHLSRQNLRTSIKKLITASFIKYVKSNQQPNQRYTLLTICDYETWVCSSDLSNQQTNPKVTTSQPQGNQIQYSNTVNTVKKRRRIAPANPQVPAFVEFAAKTFKEARGIDLIVTHARECAQIKGRLKSMPYEELCALWLRFIGNGYDGYAGYTLGAFCSGNVLSKLQNQKIGVDHVSNFEDGKF